MDGYETLVTLERVFSHPWFGELSRVDGVAPGYTWQLTYECPNSGPCGVLYAETYIGAVLAFQGRVIRR